MPGKCTTFVVYGSLHDDMVKILILVLQVVGEGGGGGGYYGWWCFSLGGLCVDRVLCADPCSVRHGRYGVYKTTSIAAQSYIASLRHVA